MEVSVDEHPRADTTADLLATLKPLFGPEGTVTAGNASGINDGAAAMIIASEAAAKYYGLVPRARILGIAAGGVVPRISDGRRVGQECVRTCRSRWSP